MKRRSKILIALSALALVFLLIFLARFNQPYLSKGGIGALGGDAYVVTKGSENTILWRPGKIWHGQQRPVSETVMFDGTEVRPFSWRSLKGQRLIVRFTPDRISIYDLHDWSGGYYSRFSD